MYKTIAKNHLKFSKTGKISQLLILSTLSLLFLNYIGLFDPKSFSLSFYHLRYKFQYYRLLTSSFVFESWSLDNFLSLMLLYRYSFGLETILIDEYPYVVLQLILCNSLLSFLFKTNYCAKSFNLSVSYLWSKLNPGVSIIFMGFIILPAFYMPFLFPGVALMMDKRIVYSEIVGILAGHMVYFWRYIYPKKKSMREVYLDLRAAFFN